MGRFDIGRAPVMRVLVTGASGLLGAATAHAMASRGHEVVVFQRRASGLPYDEVRGDITDVEALTRAMVGVQAVVHLAAKVSITGAVAEFERVNIEGTKLAIQVAKAAGAERFVYVSSPSVAHSGAPIIGDGALPADPLAARGAYSRTKATAELLVLASENPDFAVVAIRPHLVWGPGDEQLIGRIVTRARAGRLFLIDHGVALIDTTYIDNAASALVAAVERATDPIVRGRALVVTNGDPRSVAELLTRITRSAGLSAPDRSVPFAAAYGAGRVAERIWQVRDSEPPLTGFLAEQLATAHWFDQRQTRVSLNWAPAVSLDEGFLRLTDWYQHPHP